VIHDLYTRWIWFSGYALEFDALELGERPPEYEAIFTRHNGGPGLEMMFRRIGEDGRIEEFKEASDEWLRRIVGYVLSEQG
jgi:hypothetical protein